MPPAINGNVSVALGPKLAEELNRLAADRLISRSALMRQLIVDAMTALGLTEPGAAPLRGRTASRRLVDRTAVATGSENSRP